MIKINALQALFDASPSSIATIKSTNDADTGFIIVINNKVVHSCLKTRRVFRTIDAAAKALYKANCTDIRIDLSDFEIIKRKKSKKVIEQTT